MKAADIEKLYALQLITDEEHAALSAQHKQPVSLYADLYVILYAGIIMFTTGAGILIYKNIDSIGHGFIVAVLALLCIGCFIYCYKKSPGFSAGKLPVTQPAKDYILLLGCLLLLTLAGYLQYEYNLFGTHWGMATFIPMMILFIAAYYFDHLGVLSIAITNLAAWAGITVTPLNIFKSNDFNSPYLLFTGIALGVLLFAAALVSERKNFKAHYSYTYRNFSVHLMFISLLACMFYYDNLYIIWFMCIAAYTAFIWRDALKRKSFYFFVIAILYGYIALNCFLGRLLYLHAIEAFYFSMLWFIGSGIGLIKLLMHYNKILKQDADIQSGRP